MTPLKSLLLDAAHRNLLNQQFWSEDVLRRLINADNVRTHFQLRFKGPVLFLDDPIEPGDSETYLQRIVETAKKIFSLLILCDKESLIFELLEENLDDSSLPFTDATKIPEELMSSPKLHLQWGLIAPLFARGSELVLQPDTVFPFIAESGLGPNVERVQIHPEHMSMDAELAQATDVQNSFPSSIVAIKTIKSHATSDSHEFRRESDALKILLKAEIRHPNIVELFSIYTLGTDHCIMMSCGDNDLSKLFKKDCLAPNFGSSSFYQTKTLWQALPSLASALDHLHGGCGHVILHNDIKPANVIIRSDTFQLADFGIASLKSVEDTKTDWHGGTYQYSPPEYFNSHGKSGRAVDIWSLGCVFAEVMTLIVHGWGVKIIEEFKSKRRDGPGTPKPGQTDMVDDVSFHNNMSEVREWLENLRTHVPNARNDRAIDVIVSMLHEIPGSRPSASGVLHDLQELSVDS
jgi:serine/threonine protein kinase